MRIFRHDRPIVRLRLAAAVLAIVASMQVAAAEELFVSERLTPPDDRYTAASKVRPWMPPTTSMW
jgi:hypothetical protein